MKLFESALPILMPTPRSRSGVKSSRPDFGQSPTMIVTTPVGFSGAFNVDGVGPTQLIAAAHATLTLQQIDCSGGPAWVNGGVHYDLEPVPDPATLLIVRTTSATLLELARRGQRGRKQQQP